jgi:MFS transporter, DHA2 family, multidrug resistance protein
MATLVSRPPALAPLHDADHVPARTWLCVLGVLLGCFMAVLNIVLTNSSLKDIAGTLGASSDEISWVPTAYLVAEIVVIPLTAWLSQAFSLKRYLFG